MKTLTEKELIALIRSPRLEDKAALVEFLDTAPTMVANNLLHDIARNIPAKYVSKKVTWIVVLVSLCVILCLCYSIFWIVQDLRSGKPFLPTLGRSPATNLLTFFTLFLVGWEKRKLYQGTEETLFLLSARNDIRALPLLMRQWLQNPTELQRSWNDRVEAEITRLLDEKQISNILHSTDTVSIFFSSAEWKMIREIVSNVMQTKPRKKKQEALDITPGQAYLAAAVMRVLAHTSGAENGQLLKTVSELPTDAERFPYRAFVTEVAQVCYGVEAAPLTATHQSANANSAIYNAQADNTGQEQLTVSAQNGKS